MATLVWSRLSHVALDRTCVTRPSFARWNTGPRVEGGWPRALPTVQRQRDGGGGCVPSTAGSGVGGGFSGTLDAVGIDQSQRGLRVGI